MSARETFNEGVITISNDTPMTLDEYEALIEALVDAAMDIGATGKIHLDITGETHIFPSPEEDPYDVETL